MATPEKSSIRPSFSDEDPGAALQTATAKIKTQNTLILN